MGTRTTVWDLAGYWPAGLVGFRIGGSKVLWEAATATRGGLGERVRIDRLEPGATISDGIRVRNRYVDPETPVVLEWEPGAAPDLEDARTLEDAILEPGEVLEVRYDGAVVAMTIDEVFADGRIAGWTNEGFPIEVTTKDVL